MRIHSAKLVVVLAFLCASDEANASAELTISSYARGKQYVSTLTSDEIEARPEWKEDEENPPLSARKALESAGKVKDSLVKDDEHYRWHLHSAELHPWAHDFWYWVVTYETSYRFGGRPIELRLIVLMDGTVVKPEVNPWPPREDAKEPAKKPPRSNNSQLEMPHR